MLKYLVMIILCSTMRGQSEIVTTPGIDDNIFLYSGTDYNLDYEPVITDSIVWNTIEVVLVGDSLCIHGWIHSTEWRTRGNMSCLVMHYGFHCSWNDALRNRICQLCHRKEKQKQTWYQHRKEYIPTEYDSLEAEIE